MNTTHNVVFMSRTCMGISAKNHIFLLTLVNTALNVGYMEME